MTITVHGPDPVRGHIAVTRSGLLAATACDLGPVLSLWTHFTLWLTPDDARALAVALNAWADRHHATTHRDEDDALVEAVALPDGAA